MDSTKFDAWHVVDFGSSVAGKAKLKDLRESGFTTRAVATDDALNAKFRSLPDKKKALSGMVGLIFVAKGE